jgi:hypothetical protein
MMTSGTWSSGTVPDVLEVLEVEAAADFRCLYSA